MFAVNYGVEMEKLLQIGKEFALEGEKLLEFQCRKTTKVRRGKRRKTSKT